MFFYALFALSLAAPRFLRVAALAAVLGSLVIVGKLFGPFAGTFARFYTSPLLIEFVLGMFLAHLWLREEWRTRLPLALSLFLMGLGFYALAWPGSRLIVMGGAFLILAGSLHPRICAIQNRPLLALGDASYSIYLTHQFVLAAAAWIWIRLFPYPTGTSSMVFVALALVLCAAGGWLCSRLIERPLTAALRTRVKRWAWAADGRRQFGSRPDAPAGLRDR
jgi:peptidoglycan/LPS O-acetylase OafA/YrhL